MLFCAHETSDKKRAVTIRQEINTKRIGGHWAKGTRFNTPVHSAHPGGSLAIACDASVRFIPETTTLSVVKSLAIQVDGNPVQFHNVAVCCQRSGARHGGFVTFENPENGLAAQGVIEEESRFTLGHFPKELTG